ncbi:Energy-coupling factor transporter transmembrane protein EcfT [bioreactor metagenome]|uniref:Energy-coupling factor transporter transmembrane protein EcfT n=1 Tax=bioreactor metagenome TaxID=1076179 RepID=A0A644U819_9ZZZZ|nr:energy-coupling factor transporter transmembrane component T [Negativicutes bacterium]
MQKAAPLTKLILTVFVTIWAIMLQSIPALAILIAAQLLILILSKVSAGIYKGVASLFIFAFLLGGLQYVFSNDIILSVVTALKMTAMTLVFAILLATTRMQDLSAALVTQCRVPYEYAFMLTAALRFIPDLLTESKAIQEAQACRGFSPGGNPITRLTSFMAIIKPLVLKSVSRSETMALSLELRGFGSKKNRTFGSNVALEVRDYAMLALMTAITISLILVRF